MNTLSSSTPWLTLIGIGEDGRDGLSPAAIAALAQAALVVGGARHLTLAAPLACETLAWPSPMDEAYPQILARRGEKVCVLASGDPFFYGVGSVLAKKIPAEDMLCLPAPSSFSLVASRLGWPLQDCALVTLHGRPLQKIIPQLFDGEKIIALSWDGATPAKLAALLSARGFGASRMTVCENLGGPRERVRAATARDFNLDAIAPLNAIALDLVAAPDAKILPRAPGLPDEVFEHDGQITKAEFRALALSALAPRRGETLWDIGAGSGSVAIEFLLADESNAAIAIEANADRAERIARNAQNLGTPQLRIVQGRAPEALDGLPAPEKIFIGGGATAPGVLDVALKALKPGGRLVAHGVTLETQSLFVARHGELGGQLIEARIARAEKLGGFTALRPALPILQWIYDKHRLLAIGMGCATKASAAAIAALVTECLIDAPPFTRATLFSPARKASQPSLREAAENLGLSLVALDDAEFLTRQDEFCARGAARSNAAHAATGLASVAEAAALMGGGPSAVLLGPRRAQNHVTCALAALPKQISWPETLP